MTDANDQQEDSENKAMAQTEIGFSSGEDFVAFSLCCTEDIATFYVYQYHHLDDLSFVRRPEEVFSNLKPDDFSRLVGAVRARLVAAGWEGDGKLGIIWLPPFVDTNVEDTWGNYLWHVKQANNGTSWIAGKSPLGFERIKQQNENIPWNTHVRASIVFHAGRALLSGVETLLASVIRRMDGLASLSNSLITEIRDELLISAQGELVTELQKFLDACYLEVLIHVLDQGNPSKLRLSKFKVNLNPSDYIPADTNSVSERDREREGQWFTLKGFVSDVWLSFRFAPFHSKKDMLFGACEFQINAGIDQQLKKHIELRNCIQHHSRMVTSDALEHAGVKEFSVLMENKKIVKLGAGKPIRIPLAELRVFAESIVGLAQALDEHMGERVPPMWISAEHAGGPNAP